MSLVEEEEEHILSENHRTPSLWVVVRSLFHVFDINPVINVVIIEVDQSMWVSQTSGVCSPTL